MANEIIAAVGPKYLQKNEIKELFHEMPKTIKFADKISFLTSTNFVNPCAKCKVNVEKGEPVFLQGKLSYHVLCGIDVYGETATENPYYKRWAVQPKGTVESLNEYEEET
jgi:hypothetical protein